LALSIQTKHTVGRACVVLQNTQFPDLDVGLVWQRFVLKPAEFMIWFRLILWTEYRESRWSASYSFAVAPKCLSKKSGISAPEVVLEPLD